MNNYKVLSFCITIIFDSFQVQNKYLSCLVAACHYISTKINEEPEVSSFIKYQGILNYVNKLKSCDLLILSQH